MVLLSPVGPGGESCEGEALCSRPLQDARHVWLPVLESLSSPLWGALVFALAAGPPPEREFSTVPPVPTVELLAPADPVAKPRRPSSHAVRSTARRFRRGGVIAVAAGTLGLGAAIGIQIGRGAWLRRCAYLGNPESELCTRRVDLEPRLRVYTGIGLAMMVAGSASAGAMFGAAAATKDVHRGTLKDPSFARFTGIFAIVLPSLWLVGRNLRSANQDRACDEDLDCLARSRQRRWIYNDLGTLAISVGAGLLGYSLKYTKQSKVLMHMRAQPTLSATGAGLGLSGTF